MSAFSLQAASGANRVSRWHCFALHSYQPRATPTRRLLWNRCLPPPLQSKGHPEMPRPAFRLRAQHRRSYDVERGLEEARMV